MNSAETPSTKKDEFRRIEKSLIPRLRRMGYLLCVFGLISLAYGFFSFDAQQLPRDELSPLELESSSGVEFEDETPLFFLTPQERLSFYGIAAAFLLIGGLSVYAAWKKHKEFATSPSNGGIHS